MQQPRKRQGGLKACGKYWPSRYDIIADFAHMNDPILRRERRKGRVISRPPGN